MCSETRERFARAVEKHGGPEAAAASLRCSRSTIDQIIAGGRNPGMEIAFGIEKVFGIKMQAWMEPIHLENVKRIA